MTTTNYIKLCMAGYSWVQTACFQRFDLCIEALSLGTFLFQSAVQEPEEGCMQAQAPKIYLRFGLLRLRVGTVF